jgi:hypothetical protein
MLKTIVVAVLAFALAGCANNKPNPWEPIDISGFTRVTEPQKIVIPETLGAKRIATSWTDVDQDMGLLPGNYVSAFESPSAVLYFGKGRTNYWLVGGNYHLREGGIWVPKAAGEPPKLFWLMGARRVVIAPTLDDAIEQQEPETPDDVPELAKRPPLFLPPPTTGADVIGTGIAMGIIAAMSPTDAEVDGKVQTYSPLNDAEFAAKLSALVVEQKTMAANGPL